MLEKIENTRSLIRNFVIQRLLGSFFPLFIATAFVFGAAMPAWASSEGGVGRELVSTGHPPVGFTFATGQVAEMSGDFMITGYEGSAPPYSAYGFPAQGVGVQTLGVLPIDQITDIPTTGYEEATLSLSLTEGYAYAFSLPGGSYGLLYVRSATPTPSLGLYAVTMIFDYRYESGGTSQTISLTGSFLESSGQGVENAPVMALRWPFDEDSVISQGVTGSGGAFTIDDIPVGQEFFLKGIPPVPSLDGDGSAIPSSGPDDYVPVLSRFMALNDHVQFSPPFVFFTYEDYYNFGVDPDGWESLIRGVVFKSGNPAEPLAGATITAYEIDGNGQPLGSPHVVIYPGGEGKTGPTGEYLLVVGDMTVDKRYRLTVSHDNETSLAWNQSLVPVVIGMMTQESFFPAEAAAFEPDMMYMRFAGGFQLEFQLQGDMGNVATVTVTGPAGSGIDSFLLDKEANESWNVYPSETTYIQSSDFPGAFKGEYTFTATYTDGGSDTFTFDFDPGTPIGLPAGTGVEEMTGMLSWDAVTGAHGYYLVIFSGADGHGYQELYHGEDDPPIQATTFDLFAFMAGLEAAPGDYMVRVVAVDGPLGNETYGDPAAFSYQGPGPVPGLDQAIRALKVVAGKNVDIAGIRDVNIDGKIGLAEALFVLQANPGLRKPLPPVTSVSGAASLISRGWGEEPTPFDGFQFSTQAVVDMDSGDFIIEHNILFFGPGVTALDLGTVPIGQVTEVPVTGYGDEDSLPYELEGRTIAFRLADGTYAVIQFTEVFVDAGNDTSRSSFNYKWQPDGTSWF